jgi:hypothetical protein
MADTAIISDTMQTSVRSESPRLTDARSLSNGEVQVSREVSVVRTNAPTPRPSHSTPSITHGHTRANPSAGSTATEPQLNRWNSASRMSNRSLRHQARPSLHQRHSSNETALLDENRDSMKALADFLMKSEPPPNNWISNQSDDDKSLSNIKRSAFKLFGKKKNKKTPKPPKLLQLPDSAVAAKTINGARHIVISIPIEHDHFNEKKPPQPQIQRRSYSQPKLSSERAVVTILKPVAELRESSSSNLPSAQGGPDGQALRRSTRAEPIITPPEEVTGAEAVTYLENYYTQLNTQQKRGRGDGSTARNLEPGRSQRRYVSVPPVDMFRQDSQRSDPRHSGGTLYSTMTPIQGHSRGPSTVSTAPSVTASPSRKLDLPSRNSSIFRIQNSIRTELAQSFKLANEISSGDTPNPLFSHPVKSSGESTTTGTGSPSPPIMLATAETARGYLGGPGGAHVVRSLTPRSLTPKAAPTKKLPAVPVIIRPSSAPSDQAKSISEIHPGAVAAAVAAARSASGRDGSGAAESILVTRQSRQERVKARKERDIAALRSHSNSRSPVHESQVLQNPVTHVITPPRIKKGRSASQDLVLRKSAVSVSPIMVVANLAPYTEAAAPGHCAKIANTSVVRRKHSSSPNSAGITSSKSRDTHTPPHSITSSFASDSDTIPLLRTLSRSRIQSPSHSILEIRRNERRARRNASAREKEVESRLGKIERDNLVLLNTLSGIAKTFGDLSRMLPAASWGRGAGLLGSVEVGDVEERIRKGDLERMEPVMRELQGIAPRVSGESLGGWTPLAGEFEKGIPGIL